MLVYSTIPFIDAKIKNYKENIDTSVQFRLMINSVVVYNMYIR
ncbi:hypothetical protein [Clostridium cavendishii]|nr:hypothetical protein [Clostridium cavendishii]